MLSRGVFAVQSVLRRSSVAAEQWLSSGAAPSPRVLMIKEIRDQTSAPLLDCKKALDEAGTVEGALALLRAKGLKTVAKAGRVADDGALAAASRGKLGALIELKSETDFVARLDDFQQLAQGIATRLIELPAEHSSSVDAVLEQSSAAAGQTIRESIAALMYKTGEKVELKRVLRLPDFAEDANSAVLVASYVHPGAKHASLVAVRAVGAGAAAAKPELESLARSLAIQITGFKPKYISRVELPADAVVEESDESPFLLEQKFYMYDPSGPTVQDTLAQLGNRLNADISVEKFTQWSLGVY